MSSYDRRLVWDLRLLYESHQQFSVVIKEPLRACMIFVFVFVFSSVLCVLKIYDDDDNDNDAQF